MPCRRAALVLALAAAAPASARELLRLVPGLAIAQHAGDPFARPERHDRANGSAKWSAPLGTGEAFASASAYAARWDASGEIPARAVPLVGRFGALDPSEGGRTSRFRWAVRAQADGTWTARTAAVASRTASLAVDVGAGTTGFANAGAGFHPNDARAAVRATAVRATAVGAIRTRALPRAVGAEVGARRSGAAGTLAVAAWALGLQDELVWAGDDGTTESTGRTGRVGPRRRL